MQERGFDSFQLRIPTIFLTTLARSPHSIGMCLSGAQYSAKQDTAMMDKPFRAAFFVLILFIVGRPTLGEQTITCGTEGTVYENDSISLTCTFDEDLGKTKQSFYVYQFQDNSKPVIVNLCDYHADGWKCDTTDGFTVATESITTTATITIKSAEVMHSGQYVCKTLPANTSKPATPCSLTVKVKPQITCDAGKTIVMGDSTSLTCDFGFDLRKAKQDFYIYRFRDNDYTPVIIALCSWNGIDEPSCNVDHAYNLSTASIGRKVILKIPSATETHAGHYICKTLPAQLSPHASDCSLTVQTTSVKRTVPDSERLYFPALPVFFGCLTFVVLTALLFLVLRNRKFHCVKHLLKKQTEEA